MISEENLEELKKTFLTNENFNKVINTFANRNGLDNYKLAKERELSEIKKRLDELEKRTLWDLFKNMFK